MFVLENAATGEIGGTALIFSSVGTKKPFYSYKITRLSQYSRQLERIVTTNVLNLVNDFAGASEVGGLFLVPALRRSGWGCCWRAAATCSWRCIANASASRC